MVNVLTELGSPARRPHLLVLGLAFAAMFSSGPGQSFVIAVFVDELLAAAGVSRATFSLLYAAATVVSAVVVSRLGPAADRVGLRAVWALVAVGLALACGLASLVTGAVTALIALSLLRAFGQGSFPLVATLLVARSFEGRRGQATAVASFGITAAMVAMPPLAVLLVVAFGWEDAYRALGAGVLLVMLPLALLVRDRGRRPEDAVPARRGPRALRASRRLPRVTVPTRRASRLLLVIGAPPLLITAVVFHATALLGERGFSLAEAGAALSVLGAASAAGTVAAGAVADRMRSRTLMATMCAVFAVAFLVLLLPARPPAYVGLVLLGLGGGVYGVVGGVVWPRTYGLAEIGRLQGTSFAVQIAGAALGPLPLAVSDALFRTFAPALAVLAAYALLTLAVSLRWREPRIVRGAR